MRRWIFVVGLLGLVGMAGCAVESAEPSDGAKKSASTKSSKAEAATPDDDADAEEHSDTLFEAALQTTLNPGGGQVQSPQPVPWNIGSPQPVPWKPNPDDDKK